MHGWVSGYILLLMGVGHYDVCFSSVTYPMLFVFVCIWLRWLYLYTETNVNVDAGEDAQLWGEVLRFSREGLFEKYYKII